jgi:hypothetical protein
MYTHHEGAKWGAEETATVVTSVATASFRLNRQLLSQQLMGNVFFRLVDPLILGNTYFLSWVCRLTPDSFHQYDMQE